MFGSRLLIVCALVVAATPAFAEEWEEVFSEKNSAESKMYFDRNVSPVGKDSVRTKYMMVETSPRPINSKEADSPSYDKAVYRVVIECTSKIWAFSHRTYYLDGAVQLDKASNGMKVPPPPKGSGPFNISEKACALR